MTPFQLAWDLLKKSKVQESINRLMSEYSSERQEMIEFERKQQKEKEREEEVREFVKRQQEKSNFRGIRRQGGTACVHGMSMNENCEACKSRRRVYGSNGSNITEQTRLPTLSSSKMLNPLIGNLTPYEVAEMNRRIAENKNKPYRLGSNSLQVEQEVGRNNNIRRLKDQQAAAKLHLQNNPPRLERYPRRFQDPNEHDDHQNRKILDDMDIDPKNGYLYNIKSGNKHLGSVSIDDMENIGYSEVLPAYQRQGLYGKTLQAIINERNVLHSSGNRNQNSQAFHEQFKPLYTGKHVAGYRGGRHLPNNDDSDIYTYRSLRPISNPKNWGALEYDTGALPIYQQKYPDSPAEERNAISPKVGSKQINLEEYWGLDRRFNPQFSFDDQQANNLRIPRTD